MFASLDDLKLLKIPPGADAVLLVLSPSGGGEIFFGRGVGAPKIVVGELCFNTSMSGYQEVLTDPSYAGQIINFTFPHIGNVGSNEVDMESRRAFALGAVFRNELTSESNFRAAEDLCDFLRAQELVALCGADSRHLTHKIRSGSAPTVALQYKRGGGFDLPSLWEQARTWRGLEGCDLAKQVTCSEPYEWRDESHGEWHAHGTLKNETEGDYHVVAIDYGVKHNILRNLTRQGCRVTVVPADFPAEKILGYAPDGIFLSNGPGDPAATGRYAVPILRRLMEEDIPIFGICLGHQLLALAAGAETEKMQIGHRGANHPVKNLINGQVEITSQNHGFAVKIDPLPNRLQLTHVSLFDNSMEGIEFKDKAIFSVQYHPEASPGPQDSHYLFTRFVENMRSKQAQSQNF